jgi:hypothetical protein
MNIADQSPYMPSGWPGKEIEKVLVKNADRLFIWAATAMKFIGNVGVGDPTFQLQNPLDRANDNQTLSPMDNLYLRVL